MIEHKVNVAVGDKEITIGSGNIAKQADGTVTVQMGETIVMTAVVADTKTRDGQDWFPLQVDYRERASACGQIPGNYFRREGRPSDKEILTCRLTDRPIRPLFTKGWFNECRRRRSHRESTANGEETRARTRRWCHQGRSSR